MALTIKLKTHRRHGVLPLWDSGRTGIIEQAEFTSRLYPLKCRESFHFGSCDIQPGLVGAGF
jgi:hypothetical protein